MPILGLHIQPEIKFCFFYGVHLFILNLFLLNSFIELVNVIMWVLSTETWGGKHTVRIRMML